MQLRLPGPAIRIDRPVVGDADNREHCPLCRETFDRRDLAAVLWHADPDHAPEPRKMN